MTVVLITSGALVSSELASEFGLIPPSFLPVGGQRLFVHQQRLVGPFASRVLLSLPDSFEIPLRDRDLLAELGIEVVRVTSGLSLGQSVLSALTAGDVVKGPVMILHGDTLVLDAWLGQADVISVARSRDFYAWAQVEVTDGILRDIVSDSRYGSAEALVATGYFAFSDVAALSQHIVAEDGEFMRGVRSYSGDMPLRAVETTAWCDFGHVHTFFLSRSRFVTARSFNAFVAEPRSFQKSSANPAKLRGEFQWFDELPRELRCFVPAVLDAKATPSFSYSLENLYLSTLSELAVFGALPTSTWSYIFEACDEFLSACSRHRAPNPEHASRQAARLYAENACTRLTRYARATGIDLTHPWIVNGTQTPPLETVIAVCGQAIEQTLAPKACLTHGDFCFSNIFYDFRSRSIRVIDPRGVDADGNPSRFGDPRYDIAKLHHSAVGCYDFIIAGYFDYQLNAPYDVSFSVAGAPEITALFEATPFLGRPIGAHGAEPISALLFLSMLPLHADNKDRQSAFLANALRLFIRWQEQNRRPSP